MTPLQTNRLSLVSHQLHDMHPQIVAELPLKDAYGLFATCRYAYDKMRPHAIVSLPEWFTNQVVLSTETFDDAAARIMGEVSKCPPDQRFADLFVCLFKALPASDVLPRTATDNGIGLAAMGCNGCLTKVDLRKTNVSDVGLFCIASNSELKKLDLNGCKRITDLGLTMIAQRCKNLATIKLSHNDISAAGVAALITQCPELTNLVIYGCARVTEEAIFPLATSLRPKLQKISINNGCGRFTDAGLQAIAKACPQLVKLIFPGDEITDDGVCPLAGTCRNLSFLVLRQARISDKSLFALATHCKGLEDMVLLKCAGISDGGVRAILDNCDNLKRLTLIGSGASQKMQAEVKAIMQKKSV